MRILPRDITGTGWPAIMGYGLVLATGTALLEWLGYQQIARMYSRDLYIAVIAVGFLAAGIYLGVRVFAAPAPARAPGNPQAVATLGISPRELSVLAALATGQSNKEIARALGVSPNTVKTHVARLFEKLGARTRTEAVARARDLAILE